VSKKILSRDDILKISDIKVEEVHVPEWGGYVYVRTLTAAERDKFEQDIIEIKGKQVLTKDNIRAKLVARAVCNPETKERIFTDKDVEALSKKSGAALSRIYNVAAKLSGLSDEDLGELAKN